MEQKTPTNQSRAPSQASAWTRLSLWVDQHCREEIPAEELNMEALNKAAAEVINDLAEFVSQLSDYPAHDYRGVDARLLLWAVSCGKTIPAPFSVLFDVDYSVQHGGKGETVLVSDREDIADAYARLKDGTTAPYIGYQEPNSDEWCATGVNSEWLPDY